MCEILFSFVFPLLLGKWVEGSDQHRRKGFFTFLSPATMVFRALPFALLQSAVRSGPCLVLGLAKSDPSKSQKSSFIRTVEENPLQCTGVLVHSALLYFLPLHYSGSGQFPFSYLVFLPCLPGTACSPQNTVWPILACP